jgi:head-tail adaptor
VSGDGGALRVLLALEAPVATPDGGGGVATGWRQVGTLWADLRPVSAGERQSGGALLAAVTHRVSLRAVPRGAQDRPAPGRRFRDGDRRLLIRAVAEADGRGGRLTCWAEEEEASA